MTSDSRHRNASDLEGISLSDRPVEGDSVRVGGIPDWLSDKLDEFDVVETYEGSPTSDDTGAIPDDEASMPDDAETIPLCPDPSPRAQEVLRDDLVTGEVAIDAQVEDDGPESSEASGTPIDPEDMQDGSDVRADVPGTADIGARKRPPLEEREYVHRRTVSYIAKYRQAGVIASGVLLTLGFVIGLMFFLRPGISEVENRELKSLPAPTVADFLDGEYLSELSLWYSDTYPLREPMVALARDMDNLYGIQGDSAMFGGNVVADEIPELGSEVESGRSGGRWEGDGEIGIPDAGTVQAEVQNQIMQGLFVEDGAAYEIYYFSQEAVQAYADAISKAAQDLDGTADVYSIVIPNNSGAVLSDDELAELGGTDQARAIDYFYSIYDDAVIPVDAMSNIRNHSDEYIYFRTDHHWTQLGAYYAYEAFCEAKDIEPVSLDDLERREYDDFLGTFYSELSLPEMAANPDVVEAYIPSSTNDLTYWHEGQPYDVNIVNDVETWSQNALYSAFIYGDHELSLMTNPNKDDGSSCLLVKESYGNAFAPFLIEDYQDVHVIDYRYFNGNIEDYVRDNGIQDVIFLNNVTMAGTFVTADRLAGLIG